MAYGTKVKLIQRPQIVLHDILRLRKKKAAVGVDEDR